MVFRNGPEGLLGTEGSTVDLVSAVSFYDEAYYQTSCGPVAYERNDYWLRLFAGIAEEIARSLRPNRVLDAGCAKGFLVEALWARGVEAYGVDISAYAISQVRRDMQSFCWVASLTEPIRGSYDLVTCIEVLEHMPAEEAQLAVANMTAATDTILFSSTPTHYDEPTHVNVRPVFFWLKLFAEFGFQPDVVFDASFIAPHGVLFRRKSEPLPSDVLVLFSELVLYKLTLGDRNRQIESLKAELDRARQEIQQPHSGIKPRKLEAVPNESAAIPDFEKIAASLSAQLDKAKTDSQRQVVRVKAIESRVDDVCWQTQDILNSRIWRVLRFGGWILLSIGGVFVPRLRLNQRLGAIRSSTRRGFDDSLQTKTDPKELHLLHCDEPTPDTRLAGSKVVVRGWAAAQSGVESVRVQLEDRSPALAEIGLIRPDIGRHLPQVSEAKYSGFYLELDVSGLQMGTYAIRIRSKSRAGTVQEVHTVLSVDEESSCIAEYDRWIAESEERDENLTGVAVRALGVRPLISILMPVYKTPGTILQQAIDSVIAQTYPNWELCIADDSSQSEEIEALLKSYTRQDSRIKVTFRMANEGIAAASNSALDLASGEFVGLLDHDDELSRDALYWVAEALNRQPQTDVLYSDEDKIDGAGKRFEPFLKPDWSPDLLLSMNYIAHFLVCRRELMTQVGGFRSKCDGSQDYDLILRVTEQTENIVHIPRVLYHWRALPTSMAGGQETKPYTTEAARVAVRDHLERNGIEARVVPGLFTGRWRVRYAIPKEPAVSIIIASGGKAEVLTANLKSVLRHTEYQKYEIVVIDNSTGVRIERLVKEFNSNAPGRIRYINWRYKPFNYSTINNQAARQCDSPLLLFLNDDTEVISGDWLTAIVELISRKDVGCVGAKLLYPDGRIQHAGVVMGLFDNCGHAFKGMPGDRQHYFDFPHVIRNVSAVTGACLATKADVFHEVGGFDERTFAVAYNDIDLCLKIRERGYRVLYTPHAVLYHHESYSKSAKDLVPNPREVEAMRLKWKDAITRDPFYNPNLTHNAEDYSLR